jgi:flotillin
VRETANIAATRSVQQTELEAKRDIQIVAQESAIAVADKSREESEAKARAREAEALAVAAEEKVTTAKQVEAAERDKRIAVIAAQKEAETQATGLRVSAEAEKDAAQNQADAIKTIAQAKADAAKIEAEAIREKGMAEADAEAAMNDARNKLSAMVIEYELTRERIRIIPQALSEAVKPIEKISDIRIFDTGGALGRAGGGGSSGVGLGEGLAGQLLAFQANKPILDAILKEAGFSGDANAIETLLSAATGHTGGRMQVKDGAAHGVLPPTDGQPIMRSAVKDGPDTRG